jgi:hypothetical protein
MASLRQLAGCLGLPSAFSLVRDFFGYASPPPWPKLTQDNVPTRLSVLTQARLVRQPHLNLHVVRVGTLDNGRFADPVDEQQVDAAVQLARRVFAEIDVGIGRVKRSWHVPLSKGTGFDVIDDECEADELIDAYDLPQDGIKAFFVLDWSCSSATSCTVGHTDGDKDGCVVELQDGNTVGTGRALAHELGHVLGFGHENDDPSNLMCQGGTAKTALGISSDQMIPATTGFYDWQVQAIRGAADFLAGEGAPPGMPVDVVLDPTNPALAWMYVRC